MTKQILIVVDVQRAYSPFFSKEYTERVEAFLRSKQWNDIIVRFVGEDEYSVTTKDQQILHTFGEDSRFLPDFLNKSEHRFSERWFGYELDDQEEVVELVKDKLYKGKSEDGTWWYYSATPNGDMYCPDKIMESCLEAQEAEFHLIGGFRFQCLKEVYDFLTFAGIKNITIHEDLCFSEETTPNIERALEFTSGWREPIEN